MMRKRQEFADKRIASLARAGNSQSGLAGLFSSYSANQPQYSVPVDREMAMTRDVSLTELYVRGRSFTNVIRL